MEICHKVLKEMFSHKSVNCNITCIFFFHLALQIVCTASIRGLSPQKALRLHTFLHVMFLITGLSSLSLTAALFLHLVVFF